ncbi:lambda-exonuclease family protein [Thalassolituus marinus]|uniref:YqaJ viral recombinase family protein n=1 Tax=Thalassolituus marinus TaxID=671053 RepID=A0ABS7ZUN0_9GAMM|nr:YqaJ viral recombinase family protein [Thalassolituus marinus]MCA6065444.1 YqaJ viral recombinase family protein [Thalassolituus marinus]
MIKDAQYIRCQQGSPEWLQLRKNYITATEVAMITNHRCWGTFERQKGRHSAFKSPAMIRGNQLEPLARKAIERHLGKKFFPAVIVSAQHRLLASLDGIDLRLRETIEIKCPEKGRSSKLWDMAMSNKIPHRYWTQIQQGLLLTGGRVCHYWVYDEISDDGVMIDVYPDARYQQSIIKSANLYWQRKAA